MKAPLFTGVATALVTPFRGSAIDYPACERLIERQLAAGVDALVVCGTTGESAALTDTQKLSLLAFTLRTANGRCKVIAGAGSNDTAHACELSRQAASIGADGVLCVTPYYNKCTQAGLLQHYTAIADACQCPVIAYNVPSRTGVDLSVETCIALSAHPNINGLKEACGDVTKAARIISACASDLTVWSGNDDQTLIMMASGAKGVISVASNVLPAQMKRLSALCLRGEFEAARTLQLELLPLMDALFCEVNPIPVKYAMKLLGLCSGELRLPLTELSESRRALLTERLGSFFPELTLQIGSP